jgi:hypothetical protein
LDTLCKGEWLQKHLASTARWARTWWNRSWIQTIRYYLHLSLSTVWPYILNYVNWNYYYVGKTKTTALKNVLWVQFEENSPLYTSAFSRDSIADTSTSRRTTLLRFLGGDFPGCTMSSLPPSKNLRGCILHNTKTPAAVALTSSDLRQFSLLMTSMFRPWV